MKAINKIQGALNNNEYDEVLEDIYLEKGQMEYQKLRYKKAVGRYKELFGDGEVEVYSAPGRSEIGGNHTDHQQGMVLAASVNLDAIAVVGCNGNGLVHVVSKGYEPIIFSAADLEKKVEEEGRTAALIRGVLKGFEERNLRIGGFNAYVTSDVLGAAGLSSSACFETLIGVILNGLYNEMNVSMVEIAQIGQFAEKEYFGKPCGLMDQMASAVGGLVHIDFKDLSEPILHKVQVDFEKYEHSLCIVDTEGSHADLTEDYALVPREMRAVAEYFGKAVLREVEEGEFFRAIPQLRIKLGDRSVLRGIHFFQEEKRVRGQVNALEEGRFPVFLQLIKESGDSSYKYLQNVYTNHDVQKQSVSIALAVSEGLLQEHGVSRVHGGGFAGTIQAFVANDFVKRYKEEMEKVFGENSCHVLKVRNYGGVQVIK